MGRGFGRVVEAGGCLVDLTLTVRHELGWGLLRLLDVERQAWRSVVKDREVVRLRRLYGWEYVSPTEVTHGANGWHPHFQAALVFPRALSSDELDVVRAAFFSAWRRAIVAVAPDMEPDELHGVHMEVWEESAQVFAEYVGKAGDFAQEICRGDRKFSAGRNPFDLQAAAMRGDEGAVSLWAEYEQATAGRHAMTFSRGFWALLGEVDVAEGDEIAEVDEDRECVCQDVPPVEWNAIRRHPKGHEIVEACLLAGLSWSESIVELYRATPLWLLDDGVELLHGPEWEFDAGPRQPAPPTRTGQESLWEEEF
jgi:hypothetical protein